VTDLQRALLRYHGRDPVLRRHRELARFGYVPTDAVAREIARALGVPTPGGSRHPVEPTRPTAEEDSGMKIGHGESIEVWDAGMYDAKVTDVEETESTWPGKEGTPRLKFVLRVRDTEDPDRYTDLWYFTGTTLSKHPNATLRPFVKALMPEADLDDPALELDSDDLRGKRCRVVLGINQEKGRNVVEKVLPPAARKVGKPVERQPVAAGVADEEGVPF